MDGIGNQALASADHPQIPLYQDDLYVTNDIDLADRSSTLFTRRVFHLSPESPPSASISSSSLEVFTYNARAKAKTATMIKIPMIFKI